MCTLIYNVVFDTGKTIEYDSTRAAFDVVKRGLSEGDTDGEGNCVSVDGIEGGSHDEESKVQVSFGCGRRKRGPRGVSWSSQSIVWERQRGDIA